MAQTGRAAVYHGLGIPMEIREYPIPDPEPGAVVVKVSVANICGSEMHMWRGDMNLGNLGAVLPIVMGHEAVGRVARLGAGISTDSAGQPLREGDRVVWRYFYSCGRCPACLRGHHAECPINVFYQGPSEAPPHFTGSYADYYYVRPNHTIFRVPDAISDLVAAPANCALSEMIYAMERVSFRFGESIAIQGAGGLGIYATALARDMGASQIIVIDGIAQRLDLARGVGAPPTRGKEQLKKPPGRAGPATRPPAFRSAPRTAPQNNATRVSSWPTAKNASVACGAFWCAPLARHGCANPTGSCSSATSVSTARKRASSRHASPPARLTVSSSRRSRTSPKTSA